MTTAISPDIYSQMSTEQLLQKYKETGCEEYKWEVALRSSNLIKHIALRNRDAYAGFAQLDDIVHEGILALLDAIEKYDPAKGGLFSVYVSKRIRGMIFDLAREHDWVPRTIRKRSQAIDRATSELLIQLGRFPTDREVAAHLGIGDKEFREA
ncbi:MAG: sigma factor, partial [Lawsonibacter sp.]